MTACGRSAALPTAVLVRDNGLDTAASAMLDAVRDVPAESGQILKAERRLAMRRFIVGLLATVGTLTLLAIGGIAAFVASGPFPTKPLPQIHGAVARPARRAAGIDVSRPAGRRPVRRLSATSSRPSSSCGRRPTIRASSACSSTSATNRPASRRVQELRQAIAHFRGKGKFAVGFAESLGSGGTHFADYYLASALEQIWLQPSGGFAVAGIAVETPFLKDRARQARRAGSRAASATSTRARPTPSLETGYTAARPARTCSSCSTASMASS